MEPFTAIAKELLVPVYGYIVQPVMLAYICIQLWYMRQNMASKKDVENAILKHQCDYHGQRPLHQHVKAAHAGE